jgi:ankyrin repeat protein
MVSKQTSKLTRRPLIALVNSSETPKIQDTKTPTTPLQSHSHSKHEVLSIVELREQVALLKNGQDQFLFVCSSGATDEDCMLVLSELIGSGKQFKLERMKDKQGCSLMHICAMKNKPYCMDILFQNKVKIDSRDSIEATPLLHACANNCLESVTYLLTKQANVNAKDSWNKFPLQVALKNKHYRVAELLNTVPSLDVHQRGIKGNTVLHNVAAEGDIMGVQFLVEQCHATPQRRNQDEDNVLQNCLAYPAIVQYLCNKSDKQLIAKMMANVNITGSNIFHDCARHGNVDSLICILKSVDLSDFTPNQLSTMLNAVDKNGDTALIVAVKNCQTDMVRYLCQISEINLNEGDGEGHTALHHAASQKHTQMVEMLTIVGASFKADKLEEDEVENIVIGCSKALRTMLTILMSLVAIGCIITIAGMLCLLISRITRN